MTRMHPTLGCGCESGKRGLHLVVLYLVVGEWRVPWSFRVWRGKGYTSPAQLACKLLANVPPSLVQGRTVLVQADTEFGTADFIEAVRKRAWRPIVGMRGNRKRKDGRCLKDLHRHAKSGVQVYLKGIDHPLTVSWFWLQTRRSVDGVRYPRQTSFRRQTRIAFCGVQLPLFGSLSGAFRAQALGDHRASSKQQNTSLAGIALVKPLSWGSIAG